MDRKISLKVQCPRSDNTLEEGSSLSQFSPDSSPLLKSTFQPSEVLLFKGIPGDLKEIEVMQLFQGYGLIKDILIAHHKRYLFVQFENENQAIRCYQNFSENIPQIRNHDLYVCYTGKSRISKPKALLNPTSRFLQLKFNPNFFEITSDQVLQMLPPYSACERILVRRAKTWEAYLELEDVFKAIITKEYLQAQNMLNQVNQVTVMFGSEKDFGKEDKESIKEEKAVEDQEESKDLNSDFSLPSPMNNSSLYDEQNFSMAAFPCFTDPYGATNSTGISHSPTYRNSSPILGPMQSPGSPLITGRPRILSNPVMTHPPQILGNGSPMLGGSPIIMPVSANPLDNINNVLLVKNLPDRITPLMLFRLFGIYGNVMKVKILFNNPEKAFIEFQSPLQAELARAYLSNSQVLGKVLKIDFAKKGTVVDISLLKKEPDNQYLGDFTNSSEHRYKYVGSKNHANISPPSKVLHLSNMHPDKDERYYRELFRDYGNIKRFIFMKCEEKMALVQMDSVEDALAIIMNFHNYDIDGKFLKVSFSKYKKVK